MMQLIPIITCEHAGNEVPERYAHYFASAAAELSSHLGWDPGAREIGLHLARNLGAPFYKCESTRLLVEPNRSLDSLSLFSAFVQSLTEDERKEVLNQYYVPHRSAVEEWVRATTKPVAHISVHTFTPIFNGHIRDVDIGLLFDPDRKGERQFCEQWRALLEPLAPGLRVRYNEPYKGTDDGFTTYLRTLFPDEEYLGIEIEVSQRFVATAELDAVMEAISKSLRLVIAGSN